MAARFAFTKLVGVLQATCTTKLLACTTEGLNVSER